MQLEQTQKTLEKFRDYVIQQSRSNLTRQNKNVSKRLYSDLKGDVKVYKNSFSLSFDLGKYGEFQDKGVKGKFKSSKAPNSPFKFGSGIGEKGGLRKGILQWVKARGIQFRQRDGKGTKGQFLSYKETAFLITRSVYQTGIRPSMFFTKPFEAGYKKYLDKELIEQFALDVEDLMQTTLKD